MKGEKLQGNHLPERKFAPKAQEALINLGPWAATLRQFVRPLFFWQILGFSKMRLWEVVVGSGYSHPVLCYILNRSVMSDSLWPHGLLPIRLLCSWGFSMQECWSGLPCPSPGVLPNPRIKPRSCKWILYCLSHQGSPWILEWIAYPFSRGSSQPRNRTGVSCIAVGFFISCATREAL